MAGKKTVLLTGATGFVGGQCRKFWGDKYDFLSAQFIHPHYGTIRINT